MAARHRVQGSAWQKGFPTSFLPTISDVLTIASFILNEIQASCGVCGACCRGRTARVELNPGTGRVGGNQHAPFFRTFWLAAKNSVYLSTVCWRTA